MEPKNPEVGDIEIRFGTALICITSLRGWTMFSFPHILARHEGTYVVSSHGSDFKSVTKKTWRKIRLVIHLMDRNFKKVGSWSPWTLNPDHVWHVWPILRGRALSGMFHMNSVTRKRCLKLQVTLVWQKHVYLRFATFSAEIAEKYRKTQVLISQQFVNLFDIFDLFVDFKMFSHVFSKISKLKWLPSNTIDCPNDPTVFSGNR